ncbi:hypothetical protein GGI1_20346, partial [Acidithiobacillus sp. GGI-221]
ANVVRYSCLTILLPGSFLMHTEKDKELINKAADAVDLLSSNLQAMASADDLLLGEMAAALLNDARVLNNKLERIRYLVTQMTEGGGG